MSFITDKAIEYGAPRLPGLLKVLGIIDLERYAHIEDVFIDSKECRITLILVLSGESEPTAINVTYEKEILADHCFLTLKEIGSTKQWVNNLVDDFFKEEQRRIQIPWIISKIL